MLRFFASLIALFSLFAFELPAQAQVQLTQVRIGTVLYSHASIGTTAGAAISSASVGPAILGWTICADGANASYIALSNNADPDTDGVRIKAGECLACPSCSPATLKAAKVKGGAAAQLYAILQYKQ